VSTRQVMLGSTNGTHGYLTAVAYLTRQHAHKYISRKISRNGLFLTFLREYTLATPFASMMQKACRRPIYDRTLIRHMFPIHNGYITSPRTIPTIIIT